MAPDAPADYLTQYDTLLATQPAAAVGLVSRWLRTDWRPFFAQLRRERPVLVTPAFTLVTRHADVVDVLSRPRDFSVRLYQPRMDPVVEGPFMLARDETPVNWREKGLMQALLSPEDLPAVRALAGQAADHQLDIAAPHGRIEAVAELGRYVPYRICADYFGFPGPDRAAMYRWSRATQSDMFKNLQNDPAVHAASVQAGAEMREYLTARLRRLREEQRGSCEAPGDIFRRLIRASDAGQIALDDTRIVANIAGLLIGAIETTSQAIVQALAQLLARPEVLPRALEAAAAEDPAAFDAYVWEALRFDPINPLLFRCCERETRIAAGTPWETTLQPGTVVFACTASAQFDPEVFPEPHEFRPGRPPHHAFHFGFGHHVCLGLHVGTVMIPEVIRRVLLRPQPRLLPPPEGSLDFAGGPFPERFLFAFGDGGCHGS